MANVLILSLVFRPDNVSTAQIMGDLALDLYKLGHKVFVITTIPHYNKDVEAVVNQPLNNYWGKLVQRSNYFNIDVLHVWMPHKGKNKVFRIITWLSFHITSTIVGCISGFKPDIIFAPSPPLTIGISAWLIGLRHNCPFIYNVQEIYPDIAVNLGELKSPFIIRILQNLERFVYNRAGALSVISDGMAHCIRFKGVPELKVRMIPNFVDIEDFRPLPKDNRFSRQYGLSNKFVISYAGNMGKPQGLGVLIEAAHLLHSEDKIHFLLMGDGSERDSLIKKIKGLQLTNMTILPYQPYSLMAEAYATADVSFVSQAPETCNDGVPSKVYRIMACARPVIACTSENSDLAHLIRKAGGGAIVRSGDATELANVIKQSSFERDVWMKKGQKARTFILQNYSRSTVSNLYHEFIMELIHKDRKMQSHDLDDKHPYKNSQSR